MAVTVSEKVFHEGLPIGLACGHVQGDQSSPSTNSDGCKIYAAFMQREAYLYPSLFQSRSPSPDELAVRAEFPNPTHSRHDVHISLPIDARPVAKEFVIFILPHPRGLLTKILGAHIWRSTGCHLISSPLRPIVRPLLCWRLAVRPSLAHGLRGSFCTFSKESTGNGDNRCTPTMSRSRRTHGKFGMVSLTPHLKRCEPKRA
mmetsp:Transcript_85921/g.184145  ORF Transcript_85921/g.184145 Transcript_85921/m.184145 type:complete len:202 (-) Transcript_85921:1-606(-)